MSVGRICTRQVDLADSREPVWQAAERMHQRNVGMLVIVDAGKRPLGVLTDRDIVTRVIAAKRDPQHTLVGQVMTAKPRTVNDGTPIEDVLAIMRRGSFRRVPVVDGKGKLVGVISADDVLRLIAHEMTSVRRLLQRESPAAAARPAAARKKPTKPAARLARR